MHSNRKQTQNRAHIVPGLRFLADVISAEVKKDAYPKENRKLPVKALNNSIQSIR